MKLRLTEARILIYLSVVKTNNMLKNTAMIQRKLDVDYSYLCRHLRILHAKGLIKRIVSKGGRNNKVAYEITAKGEEILPIAKKALKWCMI